MHNPTTGSYEVGNRVEEDHERGVGVYLEYTALGSQVNQVQVYIARLDKGQHEFDRR